MSKSDFQLERIAKGFANHRRIQMLRLLEATPNLSLNEVARRLRINLKTASEHMRRLAIAGLIFKTKKSRMVLHSVSPRGTDILTFLRKLE